MGICSGAIVTPVGWRCARQYFRLLSAISKNKLSRVRTLIGDRHRISSLNRGARIYGGPLIARIWNPYLIVSSFKCDTGKVSNIIIKARDPIGSLGSELHAAYYATLGEDFGIVVEAVRD